jgi:MFS family permease
MNVEHRKAFWDAIADEKGRRWLVWGLVLLGVCANAIALSEDKLTSLTVALVILAAVVVAAAVAAVKKIEEIPEPKLELLDDEYRMKASGNASVDAALLVALIREQERTKSQRLMLALGGIFGGGAVLVAALGGENNILGALVSALFAILFIGWAAKVKKIRLRGLGLEVSTEFDSTKRKRDRRP